MNVRCTGRRGVRRGLAAVLLVAAMATACGTTTRTTSTSALGSEASTARASTLPDVVVKDVQQATTVNVNTLLPGPHPLLVWFWAPH